MLRMIPLQDQARLSVACDECGEPIEDASLAGFWWGGVERESHPVYLLHKACADAFCVKQLWQPNEQHWVELRNFPLFVGWALEMTPEQIVEVRDERLKLQL